MTYQEAPASFNVRAKSPDGFDIQLTLRDDETDSLMTRVEGVLTWLTNKGYKPRFTAAPTVAAPAAAGPPGAPPAPSAPGAGGAPPAAQEGTETVHTLIVGMSQAGKPQLQFPSATGKTFRCTLALPAMLALLPPGWTPDHLQPGRQYDSLNIALTWRQAGQYRNIVKLEQLS